ncbi:hypothetical protein [Methylobacterium sp. A54F]
MSGLAAAALCTMLGFPYFGWSSIVAAPFVGSTAALAVAVLHLRVSEHDQFTDWSGKLRAEYRPEAHDNDGTPSVKDSDAA